uniref:Uncharacterized protein n=1 Tax=Anguilla anguilla TaxID=7936 RepID=A0A0E9SRP1_ANGAN
MKPNPITPIVHLFILNQSLLHLQQLQLWLAIDDCAFTVKIGPCMCILLTYSSTVMV